MTQEVSTQASINDAFLWVRQVYDEARVMLSDAQRLASELGYVPWGTTVSNYATVLRAGDFPFVYLYGMLFSPSEEIEDPAGTAIFLAIDFHSDFRKGPHLLVGTIRHSTDDKVAKALNETARLLGGSGYFETKRPKGDEVVFVHRPVPKYTSYAGVEEVIHAELPLTFINTQDRLRSLVDAGIAMRDGNTAPIASLVRESRRNEDRRPVEPSSPTV